MQAEMNAALVPKHVIPVSCASSQSVPRSGYPGLPSNSTIEASVKSAPDKEVPHHPARRREPEQAIAGLRVDVQVQLLEVLDQDPALAVDDRLGKPGCARAVEHPERVVEGQRGELQRPAPPGTHPPIPSRPGSRALPYAFSDGIAPAISETTSSAVDSPGLRSGIRRSPAAPSARSARIGRSRSAPRTRARPKTRSRRSMRTPTAPPRSPECWACMPRRGPPARRPTLAARRRSLRFAGAVRPTSTGPAAAARMRAGSRSLVVLIAEDVLGVADHGAGEPLRPGHLAAAEHTRLRLLEPHVEELDDRGPEVLDVLHRPPPEVLVSLDRTPRVCASQAW